MTHSALDPAAAPAGESPDAGPDPQLDSLLALIRSVLDQPGLGPDDEVMDHGGTSLSLLRILTGAKKDFGLDIDPRSLGGVVTARNLVRNVR